jgi:hypothetical protein
MPNRARDELPPIEAGMELEAGQQSVGNDREGRLSLSEFSDVVGLGGILCG